jgi:maleate cis-trans isomerase
MAIRTRIGVMVPSTNTSCEADFQMVAPRDVTIHGHRMWTTNDAEGGESMDVMNADIETAARYLATAKVEAIAYGCTTGSFFKGPGWDKEMIQLIENTAGVPAASTSAAVTEALHFFGAKKLSIATPYPDWNNQKLREYMTAQGFEVLNLEGEPWASKAGNQGINDQDPDVIVEFASSICHPDADVLFCSCTAWRSVEAVDELERRTGKPVVTSNQATIWATFRKVGIKTPIKGYGKLLESLGAPVPA